MGQYHIVANLDKMEVLHPHELGSGLKLWEIMANTPGVGAALIVLLASHSNGNGGGDLSRDIDDQLPENDRIIGRWRGDRVVFVGDYDDNITYQTQGGALKGSDIYGGADLPAPWHWIDISERVAEVIERELDGKFTGDGWKSWVPNKVEKAA